MNVKLATLATSTPNATTMSEVTLVRVMMDTPEMASLATMLMNVKVLHALPMLHVTTQWEALTVFANKAIKATASTAPTTTNVASLTTVEIAAQSMLNAITLSALTPVLVQMASKAMVTTATM